MSSCVVTVVLRNLCECCAICRSVAQCPSVLCNVKVGCAMSRCVAKVPNPVATNHCYADYSVRHLNENENNKKTKSVQTLKRPPLREGPNKTVENVKTVVKQYIAGLVLHI